MKTERFELQGIPAILLGEPAERVWLFVHGKCGYKEEAERFAETVCSMGWQVLACDLPEHGARQGSEAKFAPWDAVPELQMILAWAKQRWKQVGLRANSIGACFSRMAMDGLCGALLVSPIVDMEKLICDMMGWAGVKEETLRERGEIPTDFGETLSWRYLTYVRQHPVNRWNCPIFVLYAGRDNMTDRATVEKFVRESGASLTVMENGEHWFHTPEQLQVLTAWERESAAGCGKE